MSGTDILFYFLSALAIGSAIFVVISKNPVYSVLWLIVTFFAISGHYILMNAQFLGIVNMIVYAGAIMVLFLFVVMLMNLNKDTEPVKNYKLHLIGIISGGGLLLVLVASVMKLQESNPVQLKTGDDGLSANLGKSLFTNYVLPFEISSVLFLSAIIGAVVIGRKE